MKLKISIFLLLFQSQFNLKADEYFDLTGIKSGQYKVISWQATPILIYHRTNEQIAVINKASFHRELNLFPLRSYAFRYGNEVATSLLRGEKFNATKIRSFDDKWFIAIAGSPEEGVILQVGPDSGTLQNPLTGNWYDLTGRTNDESKYDLSIPDYKIDKMSLTIFNIERERIIDFSPFNDEINLPTEELIIEAVRWKKFKLVSSLLEDNPHLMKMEYLNRELFSWILAYNNVGLMRKVIGLGANVNIVLENRLTPLGQAILYGKEDMVRILFENGARLETFCYDKLCSLDSWKLARSVEGMEVLLNQLVAEKTTNK